MLAEDFCYASQWVFAEITSKREYLAYMRPKLEIIKRSGWRVWAEVCNRPCRVIAQGAQERLVATVLVKVAAGRIQRADLCLVPLPQKARRTGDYPV